MPSMEKPAEYHQAVDQFGDWRWRLSNLYYITDKDGRRIRFEMNWAQERLFADMHFMNAILKARQLGFTTFIQIFMLDQCVFNSNVRAGTIAHNLTDAQAIFRDKVKYPYDNLPDQIKAAVHPTTDSAAELMLSNNSSIRVGTSLRSGTMQYLHVSEYGKLCAKYPHKAREVRTGALNTVQAGQVVFIESTAEGQEGHFFTVCEDAQAIARTGQKLTPLDFKFHFFPWWKAPEYRIDPTGVQIPDAMARYFAKLEETSGIKLDAAQKAWYVKKATTQLGDMKREYPSTPREAFEASVEGAYYGELMEQAETEGRIGHYPAEPDIPVHTVWDIARGEYTSIWFWQRIGRGTRLVGFYQNCGEGMPFYAQEVQRLYLERKWLRRDPIDVFPHDARVTEWGSNKSRIEQLMDKGFKPRIATEMSIDDGINAVRAILPSCHFDAEACAEGIKMLKNYRKEWDENLGAWKSTPRHDIHSHGSDSFRYMAIMQRDIKWEEPPKPKVNPVYMADAVTGVLKSNFTLNDAIKRLERKAKQGR
jgi:hypothetical protein